MHERFAKDDASARVLPITHQPRFVQTKNAIRRNLQYLENKAVVIDRMKSGMMCFVKRGDERPRRIAILAFTTLLLVPSIAQPTVMQEKRKKQTKGDPISPTQLSFGLPVWSPTSEWYAEEPSLAPVEIRNETITPEPTIATTNEPTRAPVSFPVVELRASGVKMTIGGLVLPLSAPSQQEMERCISDSIANSVVDILGSDQIENLDISVSLVSADKRRRLVQTERSDEGTIVFDTLIRIQSVVETHDVGRYTIGAFNNRKEQVLFLDALKETNDPAFTNLTFVSVGDSHIVQASVTSPSDGGDRNNTAGVVISILMAICAVVAAMAALVYCRHQQKKTTNKKESPSVSLNKLEHGSVRSNKAVAKTTSMDLSSDSDEIPSYIPSEILWDYSANSDIKQTSDSSERSSSVAPSDEAKSTSFDQVVDTMSLVSGDSINYDFDSIFRADDSLVSDSEGILARRQSSLTYDSDEKEKDDPKSIQIALNESNETKLLDEDNNTVEED